MSEIDITEKGEITVIISEIINLDKKLKVLEETDRKKIKNLIKKMTVKDIVNKINDEKKISKKIIYDYCIGLKNEY